VLVRPAIPAFRLLAFQLQPVLAFAPFQEMDAGPIPIGLEHGEPYGILPGAKGPANQPVVVFDAPKAVIAPADIEMMLLRASP
jgi:hypothetical protein